MQAICLLLLHTQDLEDGDPGVEERKARVAAALVDEQMASPERADLVQLLQQHNVVVRGAPADGLKLVDALLEWKRGTWAPQDQQASPATPSS